jgi:hypothetical protein
MAVRIDYARAHEGSGLRSQFTFPTWRASAALESNGSNPEARYLSSGLNNTIDGVKV